MTLAKKIVRRPKRSKWEIYHDILTAINKEMSYGEVRTTRIQFQSNLSYDNLVTYLVELERKQMISKEPLLLTQKGFQYFKNCTAVKDLAQKLGLDQI